MIPTPQPTETPKPTPRPTYDYDTDFFVNGRGVEQPLKSAHNLYLVHGIDSRVDKFILSVLPACGGRLLSDIEEDTIGIEDDDARQVWPRIHSGIVDVHQQNGFQDVNFTLCIRNQTSILDQEAEAADIILWYVIAGIAGVCVLFCVCYFARDVSCPSCTMRSCTCCQRKREPEPAFYEQEETPSFEIAKV